MSMDHSRIHPLAQALGFSPVSGYRHHGALYIYRKLAG